MDSEMEVARILADAVMDGKRTMEGVALVVSGAAEGLVAAGKDGAVIGETVRKFAIEAMT